MIKNKIEFNQITKLFGDFVANDEISFQVKTNEIHALLGENGAGKTTLMSQLFGLIRPTNGYFKINGEKVRIKSPREAAKLSIAMLPQHFQIIEELTVWENIIIGYERTKFWLNKQKLKNQIKAIQEKYQLEVDLNLKVKKLSIFDKQKVELLKILWNDADILILDEPTSILTPLQTKAFLKMLINLKEKKKTILLITHKLSEIQQVADQCTIIRKGKLVKTVKVSKTSNEKLAEYMVGNRISLNLKQINKKSNSPDKTILKVDNLSHTQTFLYKKLSNISFEVKAGEIVGVAAIDGNGASELFKVIAGLLKASKGDVFIEGLKITRLLINKRYYYKTKEENNSHSFQKLISHIPEDRHREGLILDYSVTQNLILQDLKRFSRYGIINKKKVGTFANSVVKNYDIRGLKKDLSLSLVRQLSGGNQQKLILAREIERYSKLLLAFNPTRGLDVNAIFHIYEQIINYRNKGGAVLLFSSEIDEILEVADRIAVLYQGELVIIKKANSWTKNNLGLVMAQGNIKGETNV